MNLSYSEFNEEIKGFFTEKIKTKYGEEKTFNFLQESDKRKLFDFFIENNFDLFDFKKIIAGAKFRTIISKTDFVKFNDEKNAQFLIDCILNIEDLELNRKLADIKSEFNKYYKTNFLMPEQRKNLNDTIKKIWDNITKPQKKVNENLKESFKASVNILDKFSKLYNVLIEHLGTSKISITETATKKEYFIRVVDDILTKKFKNTVLINKSINDEQIENIRKFLKKLENAENINEKFNKEEIIKLLEKTSHVLLFASDKKLDIVRRSINNYIKKVSNEFNFELKPEIFNSKSIILQSGSIIKTIPGNINFAGDLFIGKSLSEALEKSKETFTANKDISLVNAKKYVLYNLFPDFKIEGTNLEFNKNVLSKNVTILENVNPSSLYRLIDGLSFCLCEAFDNKSADSIRSRIKFLNEIGFDFNRILTTDNISYMFNGQEGFVTKTTQLGIDRHVTKTGDNLIKNVNIFSKLLPAQDIFNVFKYNYKILTQDQKKLLQDLSSLAKGKTIDEFKEAFTAYVNNKVSEKLEGGSASRITNLNSEKKTRLKKDRKEIEISDMIIDEDFLKELGIININITSSKTNGKKLTYNTIKKTESDAEIDNLINKISNNDFEDTKEESFDDELDETAEDSLAFCDKLLSVSDKEESILKFISDEWGYSTVIKKLKNADQSIRSLNDETLYEKFLSILEDAQNNIDEIINEKQKQMDDLRGSQIKNILSINEENELLQSEAQKLKIAIKELNDAFKKSISLIKEKVTDVSNIKKTLESTAKQESDKKIEKFKKDNASTIEFIEEIRKEYKDQIEESAKLNAGAKKLKPITKKIEEIFKEANKDIEISNKKIKDEIQAIDSSIKTKKDSMAIQEASIANFKTELNRADTREESQKNRDSIKRELQKQIDKKEANLTKIKKEIEELTEEKKKLESKIQKKYGKSKNSSSI